MWRKPAFSPHRSAGPRLAAILPVSEETIVLYQPIILPVAISVHGLLLISAGAHQPSPPAKAVRGRQAERVPALARARSRRRPWFNCDAEPDHTPGRLLRLGFFLFGAGDVTLHLRGPLQLAIRQSAAPTLFSPLVGDFA